MIVKIASMDKGWLFLTADTVKVRALTEEQYKFGISEGDPHHVHVDLKTLYCSDGQIFVQVVNINCGEKIVYTNQPIYLLNDNGGTVERL